MDDSVTYSGVTADGPDASVRVNPSVAAGVFGLLVGLLLVLVSIVWLVMLYKLGPLSRTTKIHFPYIFCVLVSGALLLGDAVVFSLAGVTIEGFDGTTLVCRIIAAVHLCPNFLGLLILLSIGLDRYLVIAHPASYPDLCGWRKLIFGLVLLMGCTCALMLTVAATPRAMLSPDNTTVAHSHCYLTVLTSVSILIWLGLPLSLLCLGYIIMCASVHHIVRIHQRRIQVTNTINYANLVEDEKWLKLYARVAAVVIVMWLPLVVTAALSSSMSADDGNGSNLWVNFKYACVLLGSLSNLVLFIRFVKFKKEYMKAFKSVFRKEKPVPLRTFSRSRTTL